MRAGKAFFNIRYLFGRAPWDTQVTPPEVVALVEGSAGRPGLLPGRALDLGCGTGTNSVYLARHGWDVVGVDFSALASRRAVRRARQAGTPCTFYQADVSDLDFLRQPFDLALDIGCLHSVPRANWPRVAAELERLVRPGGVLMLYAFVRDERDSVAARGITPAEVRQTFAPGFEMVREESGADPGGPRSAWYWLRRAGGPDVADGAGAQCPASIRSLDSVTRTG